MTENQKLREALQKAKDALSLALSDVDWRKDSLTQPVIHKAYNCAHQALALPTAVPVGEREAFERTMMDKYGWQREDFKLDDFGYFDGHTDTAWMAWQARAALSAGDAADAQRWKTSELISRTALTLPKHRTETESIAFNAYRKAMESGQSYAACVDAAIDAAMRKDKT